MKRNTMFYVWKVIVPLGLTIAMGCVAFFFEYGDLEARLNHVTTLLLSTFALVFVISAELPKTDFMTKIDYIITTTMVVLVGVGFLSGIMYPFIFFSKIFLIFEFILVFLNKYFELSKTFGWEVGYS